MTNACVGPEEPKLASCPIRQGQGGEMRMTLKALDSDLKVSDILHCRHRYLFAQALTGHGTLETGMSWMSQPCMRASQPAQHPQVWGTLMAVKGSSAIKAGEHSDDGMCTTW